jgi:DNA polymerase elongation subunit (family B)
VFPNVKKEIPDVQASYEGAWVIPVSPGIYRQVGGLDFASLYPSVMREWNISPENFRYKKGPDYKLKKDEIRTVSGAIYGRDKQAMIPAILTHYYNLRKQAKNDMKTADQEAEFLEEILERREKEAKKAAGSAT